MKNYIAKLQKGGIKWLWMCVAIRINKLFFHIFQYFPLNKKLIVFESEGDFCDNAYALYSYMLVNGYMKKYKAVWLVEYVKKFQERKLENTKFCYKNDDKMNFIRDYYLAVCGHYIYDHCLIMDRKRKGQRVTYLSHGAGFKASKGFSGKDLNGIVDEMIVTGEVSGDYISMFWKFKRENVIALGYPRNDYFFQNEATAKEVLNSRYKFNIYNNVILWMPTFRESRNPDLSENYLSTGTGLPLLDNKEKLKSFDSYLKEKNYLMILKIHQLSKSLPIYNDNFSNILILTNEDIHALGIQLYQFVACTDMLITDYSSISMDYLLLDKPCIYTLDDYEQYNKSRGVFPANAIDYMAGYHVYALAELENALEEIQNGVDKYSEERSRVRKQYHTYLDGESSKRIVRYLGL